MRVLQFGKFYPPDIGGIELFMYDLTEALSESIDLDVLCSNSVLRRQIDGFKRYKVYRSASFGKLFSTSITPYMVIWLKKLQKNYDIIHMHLPDPMATLAYYFVKPNSRLIVHWHSDIIRQKHLLKLYKPLQEWILNRADKIIATSPPYIDSSSYLREYRKKCISIPLGLNPERLVVNDSKVRKIKQEYKKHPIVLSIGRLVYYKGYEFLIRAMKEVKAILLLGGNGPLQENLEAIVIKHGLEKRVFLLGQVADEDLGSYYKACDLFCLPSIERSEAFGLVQCEAMYFGKPIVATCIEGSGTSWVNQHNVTGLNVQTKDPHELAKAINMILSDQKLYRTFSYNAFNRFYENFHISTTAKKIITIYEELLSN